MIKVLKSGFYTTIQDKGRVGFASLGVPVSGAMDSYSSDLANLILNNSLDCALLEITLGGCKFQFLSETKMCISGGDFSPTINSQPILLNSKISIQKNDILSFGKVNFGVRCYAAVKGGILSDIKLGSRSLFKNITSNFLLKSGDYLPISNLKIDLETSRTLVKVNKNHFESKVIECFRGPEFNTLDIHQRKILFETEFSISKDINRMGYKLNEILENNIPSILTTAVLPGTVQLTPSGKLIVLMRDCQVTGGYPRVLQVSEASINRLSQKMTADKIQFVLQ
ncbi:allophanate hydrolase [Polaribacter filamentus]|jgi:biotin-dependent carboxylase-like uncharacterized protein|uniref:Allophanate hydrolase n=1 Tax=Polaribacter filamentus TaxID=53483 RepID=A0A2S7KZQ4_9FLAO|nr:biotin-dependent carboxyltransferase family protein [Polaribacter filamentus]PQB07983.1 allophanate hydrolase [Polaribacter filamentus]